MSPEDRDKIRLRLLAAWPTPKLPDSTLIVWNEHLDRMRFDRAAEAIKVLERTAKHRPALSEFHEAYDSLASKYPEAALTRPACGICDPVGWIPSRCDTESHDCDCGPLWAENGNICPRGARVSSRCPNGCTPLSHAEIMERTRIEEARWRREHRSGQRTFERVGARDFTEPGSKSDADEVF